MQRYTQLFYFLQRKDVCTDRLDLKPYRNMDIIHNLLLILVCSAMIFSLCSGIYPAVVCYDSMAPTYPNGSIVLEQRFRAKDQMPEYGDVVTFYLEGEDVRCIKRVIGLPGDEIEAADDRLYVNGVMVDNIAGTGSWIATVPEEYVFLMGDNRSISLDSRQLGAVHVSQLYSIIL